MMLIIQLLAHRLRDRVRDQHGERGATAVEYGMIVACAALVFWGGIEALGLVMGQMYESTERSVQP